MVSHKKFYFNLKCKCGYILIHTIVIICTPVFIPSWRMNEEKDAHEFLLAMLDRLDRNVVELQNNLGMDTNLNLANIVFHSETRVITYSGLCSGGV